MMKHIRFIILMCITSVVWANTPPITVAITNFRTLGATPDKEFLGVSCSEGIYENLINDHAVRVVEREYLNNLIDEIKLQNSGMVDEKTAVETGKLLGAQYFIFGSVTLINTDCKITTRVVSVTTGQVVNSHSVTGSLGNLFGLQAELARKITAALNIGSQLLNAQSSPGADLSDIPIQSFQKLDQLKVMVKPIPVFGFDPARKRKTAEYQQGLSFCDELISQSPRLYMAYYYKALFLMQMESFDKAEAALKVAKGLNPNSADVMMAQANFHLLQNNDQKAQDLLRFLKSKYPQNALIWYGLAKVQSSSLQYHEGIESAIQCMRNTPQVPQAEKLMRTLVEGLPDLSPTQFEDAATYAVAKIYKTFYQNQAFGNDALALAQQAAETWPDLYMPHYIIGVYHMSHGNPIAARQSLERSIALNPLFPQAHRELGKLQSKQGDCATGSKHLNLYMKTADSISDFNEIERYIKNCN